jgi:hypothetical protein
MEVASDIAEEAETEAVSLICGSTMRYGQDREGRWLWSVSTPLGKAFVMMSLRIPEIPL